MHLFLEEPLKFAFSRTDFHQTPPPTGEESENLEKASYGIIGVPFDSTTTYQPGARFGPLFVREASYNFERYNLILNKTLDARLYDFGNLEAVPGNFQETCLRLESVISSFKESNIIPLAIGGEHTISYSILKALDVPDVTVLHLDAHMDLRDDYMGEKFSHATVMRRICELNPSRIIQMGVRSASEEETIFARENRIEYHTSPEIKDKLEGMESIIKEITGPVYVTLDLDVLDPAYAPSVGTPTPGGLDPFELEKLIFSLKGKNVIGFDLVETSSTSIGDITSLNAAKIILDFLFLE